MERFQLMPLPCKGLGDADFRNQRKEFINLLATVVEAEKRRQMNIEVVSEWPQNFPWGIPKVVWSMPIVICVKKYANKGVKKSRLD